MKLRNSKKALEMQYIIIILILLVLLIFVIIWYSGLRGSAENIITNLFR